MKCCSFSTKRILIDQIIDELEDLSFNNKMLVVKYIFGKNAKKEFTDEAVFNRIVRDELKGMSSVDLKLTDALIKMLLNIENSKTEYFDSHKNPKPQRGP
jgi:hypothetical protein